jgi:hypothetical protein
MTVSDLMSILSSYPADARVTLLDPDKGWLLPIEITHLLPEHTNCGIDFIAITADNANDEIEGVANDDSKATRSVASAGRLSLIS